MGTASSYGGISFSSKEAYQTACEARENFDANRVYQGDRIDVDSPDGLKDEEKEAVHLKWRKLLGRCFKRDPFGHNMYRKGLP
jgi:hypothetical protein